MKRKEYCESSCVQEFIRWLSHLMDKEDSFTHTYIIAKTKERWKCNSIYAAFDNYNWSFYCADSNGKRIYGNSFWDSKKVLDECSNQLRTSLYLNDEEAYFSACRQILEWGGVTNKNLDRIRRMKMPEICNSIEELDYEAMYSDLEKIMHKRPSRMHKMAHYELEKIFSYLEEGGYGDNYNWGLEQAKNFAEGFAKKWVKIEPYNMSSTEIKLLVRIACYLEYIDENRNEASIIDM